MRRRTVLAIVVPPVTAGCSTTQRCGETWTGYSMRFFLREIERRGDDWFVRGDLTVGFSSVRNGDQPYVDGLRVVAYDRETTPLAATDVGRVGWTDISADERRVDDCSGLSKGSTSIRVDLQTDDFPHYIGPKVDRIEASTRDAIDGVAYTGEYSAGEPPSEVNAYDDFRDAWITNQSWPEQ